MPSHQPARVGAGYVEDDMLWTPHATPAMVMSINCILASIQSFLAKLGLRQYDRAASLWMFFAACGIAELCISFLICYAAVRQPHRNTWV
jgi:hypothetical protein